MNKIPNKDRKEWKELVTGQLDIPLKNFFFQTKVTQIKSLFKNNKLSLEKAIEDIYNVSVKFSKEKNISEDIEAIFGAVEMHNETQHVIKSEAKQDTFVKKEQHINREQTEKRDSLLTENEDSVKAKIERIKGEAAEREARFKEKRLERENELIEEKKIKEDTAKKAIIERKNKMLEEEKIAKEEITKHKQIKEKSQVSENRKTINFQEGMLKKNQAVLKEKEALKQAVLKEKEALKQASIKRRAEKRLLEKQNSNKKKKTFFQKLFDSDSN